MRETQSTLLQYFNSFSRWRASGEESTKHGHHPESSDEEAVANLHRERIKQHEEKQNEWKACQNSLKSLSTSYMKCLQEVEELQMHHQRQLEHVVMERDAIAEEIAKAASTILRVDEHRKGESSSIDGASEASLKERTLEKQQSTDAEEAKRKRLLPQSFANSELSASSNFQTCNEKIYSKRNTGICWTKIGGNADHRLDSKRCLRKGTRQKSTKQPEGSSPKKYELRNVHNPTRK